MCREKSFAVDFSAVARLEVCAALRGGLSVFYSDNSRAPNLKEIEP